MSGRYDEHFPDEYPGYGEYRYGEVADMIVLSLSSVLDAISEPLPLDQSVQEWHIRSTVFAVAEMDMFISCLRPDGRVSIEELSDLDSAIAAARGALPISEAESRWLRDGEFNFEKEIIGFDNADDLAEHLAKLPKHRAGSMVDRGRWVLVSTEELESRWLAWRRQDGIFAGQGSLDLAREALRTAIQIMEPDRGLPTSYLELRGRREEP